MKQVHELISIIRKTVPKLIANDIINVQPMTGPGAAIHTLRVRYADAMPKFELTKDHDCDVPDNYCVIDVQYTLVEWIESQPIDQWKPVDSTKFSYDRYIVSEELFTMLALRFG